MWIAILLENNTGGGDSAVGPFDTEAEAAKFMEKAQADYIEEYGGDEDDYGYIVTELQPPESF